MDLLDRDGFLDNVTAKEIEALRVIRNEVVHGNTNRLTQESVNRLEKLIYWCTTKREKLVNRPTNKF
jgi:hypothetical protein